MDLVPVPHLVHVIPTPLPEVSLWELLARGVIKHVVEVQLSRSDTRTWIHLLRTPRDQVLGLIGLEVLGLWPEDRSHRACPSPATSLLCTWMWQRSAPRSIHLSSAAPRLLARPPDGSASAARSRTPVGLVRHACNAYL
eukprot:5273776-Amphidinium_carterae.1